MAATTPTPDTPRRFKLSWSFALTVVLAVMLMVLAFGGADWGEMLATVQQSRGEYLIIAFWLVALSYFLRALRWRVLLNAERPVHPLTAYWGTNIGYLGNSFLPARAGELIRTALISRHSGINVMYVLATALTERIFDAALLVLFIIALLPTLPGVPDWLVDARQVMFVVGVGGFIVLLLAPRFEGLMKAVLGRFPLPDALKTKLTEFLENFLLGLRALQDPRRAVEFILITTAIWAVDVLLGLAISSAFDIVLTWQQVLFLLAALGLSSAVPSTPGYLGVYHFVTVTVLEPFGVSQNQALVYILSYQAVAYANVILFGLFGLWRLNVMPDKQNTTDEETQQIE